MGSSTGGSNDVEAGFAELQGEDFELGYEHLSPPCPYLLRLPNAGVFALEVLGKNGCFKEGVLHLHGNPPIKLNSQDLLQIGDKEFNFFLPVRSILSGPIGPSHHVGVNMNYPPAVAGGSSAMPVPHHGQHHFRLLEAADSTPEQIGDGG
ncbi:OLC1v1002333C1 [Oldenlandia corymbosa var. corymbosa]|uniref:OLC1v1002333C1 n=1 Tax=Oldenlandia corymbosa var. corymbosa TaxID=529605 RepID=A0AAV1DAV7_OLDCO|nr:OLC1v1002333C1 [Oldenlandia corymbosa var. corymbosa]